MPTFNDIWSPKMETGIANIDEHHRKLVHLLIDIYNVSEMGGMPERVREILAELVSYTKYHFAAEERLMLEIKYPRLQEQRNMHAWFTNRLNEYFLTLSTKDAKLPSSLLLFLRDWYANHILKHDIDIGIFIHSKKT